MGGVRILLPVWGKRPVQQFLEYGLPSLLAHGNLPALTVRSHCTFQLLTRTADIEAVKGHAAWRALEAICAAEIMPIDELISRASAVTLTLAYAKAMRAAPEGVCGTTFFYLVGDYVMADGSLGSVFDALQEGARAVLAGNFQVERETFGPALHDHRAAENGSLSLSPRALTALSLAHLHPQTLASVAGVCETDEATGEPTLSLQPMIDAAPNRFFWRVDDETLLGRFFLMHMVAIRPEVDMFRIEAPSDYAFLPELCPRGQVAMMTDSDRYFVVEMNAASTGPYAGPHRGKRHPLEPKAIAGSIDQWATAGHRNQARTSILFHAGEPDEKRLAVAEKAAGRLVDAISSAFSRPPQDHRRHPFWSGMLDHHRSTAVHSGHEEAMAVLLGEGANDRPRPTSGLRTLRQSLLGDGTAPRTWHPRSPDIGLLKEVIEDVCAGVRVGIASDLSARARRAVVELARQAGALSTVELSLEEGGNSATGDVATVDVLLAVIREPDGGALDALLGAAGPLLAPDARVVFFVADLDSDAGAIGDLNSVIEAVGRFRLGDGGGRLLTDRVCAMPLNRMRGTVQKAMLERARAIACSPSSWRFGRLPFLFGLAVVSAMANRFTTSGPVKDQAAFTSVALVCSRRQAEPGGSTSTRVSAGAPALPEPNVPTRRSIAAARAMV